MVKKIFKSIPTFFFYLFLLSIPLQARIVFSQRFGSFNEYTSYFLYISDIFLIITLISWFVKLLYSRTKNVSRETRLQPGETSNKKSFVTCPPKFFSEKLWRVNNLLFVIFVAWSFLSLIWAQNLGVGLFRAIKLTEFALLFLFVIHNIKTQKRPVPLKDTGHPESFSGSGCLFWTALCLMAAGSFQAIIGIWQYFIQHSIGLKWLGETILSPKMPGVAKIMVGGQKVMRAYGTFPHPNVFAGFLLLSITCGLLLLFREKRVWFQYFLSFVVSLQLIALVLTFSRTAWIGMAFLFIYSFINLFFRVYPRSYPREAKRSASTIKLAFLAVTLVILVSGVIFWPQIASRFKMEGQALEERGLYNNLALSMIKKSPILGVGMGNFVARMGEFTPAELQPWQYQPVHNIYLLILAELGVIGLILFAFFIFNILKTACPPKFFREKFWRAWLTQKTTNVSRETSLCPKMFHVKHFITIVFIGFLFIGFFDHYFWTLQQGGLMFWLVLGILMVQFNNRSGQTHRSAPTG